MPTHRMSAKNALITARLATTTIVAKYATLVLLKQMILNFVMLDLVHLAIIYKRQIVLDANRNVLLVVQVQHAIPALLGILMQREVNAIQSVVMEAEMMMKNATILTLMMKMAVRVNALLKITMYACLLTPQLWVPTFVFAMQSLFLPPGLSIGEQLKSSLGLKLFTILTMVQSQLTLKSSALKYCIPQCLTTKTQEQNTTASWMPVGLRAQSESMLIQMPRLVILISNSKQKLGLSTIL